MQNGIYIALPPWEYEHQRDKVRTLDVARNILRSLRAWQDAGTSGRNAAA